MNRKKVDDNHFLLPLTGSYCVFVLCFNCESLHCQLLEIALKSDGFEMM